VAADDVSVAGQQEEEDCFRSPYLFLARASDHHLGALSSCRHLTALRPRLKGMTSMRAPTPITAPAPTRDRPHVQGPLRESRGEF
jgi:hypothetical protein